MSGSVVEQVKALSSIIELKQVIGVADARIEELASEGVAMLAAQYEQMAAEYGITAKKVLAVARKKARKPRASRKGESEASDI